MTASAWALMSISIILSLIHQWYSRPLMKLDWIIYVVVHVCYVITLTARITSYMSSVTDRHLHRYFIRRSSVRKNLFCHKNMRTITIGPENFLWDMRYYMRKCWLRCALNWILQCVLPDQFNRVFFNALLYIISSFCILGNSAKLTEKIYTAFYIGSSFIKFIVDKRSKLLPVMEIIQQ